VFRVDLDRVRGVVGSRNQVLWRQLEPILRELVDEDDLDDEEVDDEDRVATPVEALRQILDGTVPNDLWGGEPYYQALAAIYEQIGADVDDLILASSESNHLGAVDEALKTAGAVEPLTISSLFFGGVPIKLPSCDEPSLGYLDAGEVSRAREQYEGVPT